MGYSVDEVATMRTVQEILTDWRGWTPRRNAYIDVAEGVHGGRSVIRGTRLTVSAIYGRLSSGDTFADLAEDCPDITREAFEAAFLFGKTLLGRPARRRGAKIA